MADADNPAPGRQRPCHWHRSTEWRIVGRVDDGDGTFSWVAVPDGGRNRCCGVPAVATDVGDARTIVGEAGLVVPPSNVAAFADAMQQLLSMPQATRQLKGMQARERMKERFELAAVAKQYLKLYGDVLNG